MNNAKRKQALGAGEEVRTLDPQLGRRRPSNNNKQLTRINAQHRAIENNGLENAPGHGGGTPDLTPDQAEAVEERVSIMVADGIPERTALRMALARVG